MSTEKSEKSKLELQLDRLLAKKEGLFRRMQLCYDAGQQLKANRNDPKLLEQFKIRYGRVSKTVQEFEDLAQEIVALQQQIKPKETLSYSFVEGFDDLVDTIEYLAVEFIKIPDPITNPSSSSNTTENKCRIHMPKIELMKFDGEDMALWPVFYENFKQFVHCQIELSNAEKLQYLLSSLTGKALKTCSSVESIPKNYPIIWKLLEDTYQDQKYLANLYLDRLFNFRLNYSANQNQLQLFLEKFHSNLVALKRLKIDNLEDYILTYLAMTKLPHESVSAFELLRDDKDLPTYDELIEFVRRQSKITKIETLRSGNKNQSSNLRGKSFLVNSNRNSNLDHNSKQISQSSHNMFTKATPNCIICGNSIHSVSQCQKFLKLTPTERFKLSKEKGLCLNCLHPSHKVSNCHSKNVCHHCKSKHHSLLHFENTLIQDNNQLDTPCLNVEPIESQTIKNDNKVVHSLCSREQIIKKQSDKNKKSTVLLSTAVVFVLDANAKKQSIRLLLDSGSQGNFLSLSCCKRLGLNIFNSSLSVQGIGSTATTIRGYSHLNFISQFNKQHKYSVEVFVIDKITNCLPSLPIDVTNFEYFYDLPLADSAFNIPGEVDGILGADLVVRLLRTRKIFGPSNGPIAVETSLGYVIMGKAPILDQRPSENSKIFLTLDPLENLISKFWEVENISAKSFIGFEDAECEKCFQASYTRNSIGRYAVPLLFKSNPKELGNSYDLAFRRFLSLERKLENNSDFRIAYNNVIQDYIDQKHISLVHQSDLEEISYFIPHHAVFKDSISTPIRVVFDASMKTDSGISLNDLLYAGPKLQSDLFTLLLDFRLFPIALTADIKQMFRQIEIIPEHRKYQRFIWRFAPDEPISIFQINTVCFGVKCSPYLALRTVQQLAHDESSKYPEASRVVQNNFYIDDFVYSVENDIKAEALYLEMIKFFRSGQFELAKWASNSMNLMNKIPESLKLDKHVDFDETFKVLGLTWHPVLDYFSFRLGSFDTNSTKRNVLSVVAQIYDPLGLIAPITLFAKKLIRDFWIEKLDWDQKPPKYLEQRWFAFCNELNLLKEIEISRHLTVYLDSLVSLIGFADSSESGYAAVIYVRTVTNDDIQCRLLCSKSKVAPLKALSIPRLELCAALLLAKLLKSVIDIFSSRIAITNIFAFSDSTIVLNWLNSSPHRWNTFVANRVASIQEILPGVKWYHIASHLNMADSVSRGMTPSYFISNQISWFSGPPWILKPESSWPIRNIDQIDTISVEEKSLISLSCPATENQISPLYAAIERFSSWNRLVNATVYVLRFAKILPKSQAISLSDISTAEEFLIKTVQAFHFSSEINNLSNNKNCSSNIRHLKPFLDQKNILRVGGRLSNAAIEYDHQHPILLPNKEHLVNLLVDHYHRRNLHVGTFILSSLLRQKYWIIAGRHLIRKRISLCNLCFHHRPKATFPIMADLPAPRVNEAKAFLHTGTDYAGPFRITLSRHRGIRSQKAYLCIFICLTTKAVHMELCSDLSTETFIAALKRFLSRRGTVSVLYSDCGSNYIGTKSYLKELYQMIESSDYCDAVKGELLANKIVWKLNPPHAPHFGGLWESNIKSCKSILMKVIGNQILTYEELNTVIIQIEALLNSRPLYNMSTDPSDPAALTPAHFLCSSPLSSIPAPDISSKSPNLVARKLLLDQIVQSYWKRWHLEYLSTLQSRQKWNSPDKPIKIGTVVLLIIDNLPPFRWPLGVITEVYPGSDGIIRVASVRTSTGTYKRPVVRLCPLPTQ